MSVEVSVTFHSLETETIDDFHASRQLGPEWIDSKLRDLVPTAPSTKASFARKLIARLAEEAGVEFRSVEGRVGSRRRIGRAVCEIKFSTEDPARFQQVRPPSDGYDYLIGVGAHPKDFVYWVIPAAEVQSLIEQREITYQHAETSLWFFPEATGTDPFSPYRLDAQAVIKKLGSFS
jgi:hypothetical protein